MVSEARYSVLVSEEGGRLSKAVRQDMDNLDTDEVNTTFWRIDDDGNNGGSGDS